MHVSKLSYLIIMIMMERQMIGDLTSQTSMKESPALPVVLSVLQNGPEEGSCDVSVDCIYHSDSLPV